MRSEPAEVVTPLAEPQATAEAEAEVSDAMQEELLEVDATPLPLVVPVVKTELAEEHCSLCIHLAHSI